MHAAESANSFLHLGFQRSVQHVIPRIPPRLVVANESSAFAVFFVGLDALRGVSDSYNDVMELPKWPVLPP